MSVTMPSAKQDLHRPTNKYRHGEHPTGFTELLRIQNKAVNNSIQTGIQIFRPSAFKMEDNTIITQGNYHFSTVSLNIEVQGDPLKTTVFSVIFQLQGILKHYK